jgi:hypothetical protein
MKPLQPTSGPTLPETMLIACIRACASTNDTRPIWLHSNSFAGSVAELRDRLVVDQIAESQAADPLSPKSSWTQDALATDDRMAHSPNTEIALGAAHRVLDQSVRTVSDTAKSVTTSLMVNWVSEMLSSPGLAIVPRIVSILRLEE